MNNRGSILVIVLIFTAVLAAGAIALLGEVSDNLDWTERLHQENQATFYIHSAISSVIKIINDDNNSYDSTDDMWANLPIIPIKNGSISVKVIPANAKIDINEIDSTDKAVAKRVNNATGQILLEANQENIENLDGYIKGWIDKRSEYDNNYYQNHQPPYSPTKEPFYSLEEIDYVKGLDNFAEKFGSYFTVDGEKAININFADKKVIQAYLPEIADAADDIIKYRKKRPFENITQLRNVAGISDIEYLAVQPFISTTSSNFIVKVVVNIGKMEYNATILLKRMAGKTEMAKYFEGNLPYE